MSESNGSEFRSDEIAALRTAGTALAGRIAIGARRATALYRRAVGGLWPDIIALTNGISASGVAAPAFRLAVDGYLVREGRLALGDSDSGPQLAAAFRADPAAFMAEIENGCCNLIADDGPRQRTIICSDGSGCLPFYLHQSRDRICFAGDLPGLRVIAGDLERDTIGCAELYWFGYQIGDRTIYRNVRCILPGSILEIDWRSGTIESGDWISTRRPASSPSEPAVSARNVSALQDAAATVVAAMLTACRRLQSPERRYAIKLSGGMDSRLIAGCWQAPGLLGFNYTAPGAAESAIAQRLARKLGIPLTAAALDGDFFSKLHKPLLTKYGLAEFFHQALTTEMVKSGVDCALDGMGGDVLFGGLALKRKGGPGAALRNALGIAAPSLGTGVSNDRAAELIFGQILVGDANFRVLNETAQAEVEAARTEVLHDLAREYASCDPGAAFERRYRRFAMRNRMRRYIALQGALCRPWIETLYPFLDRDVQALAGRIGLAALAGKQFYRLLFQHNLPHIAGVPFVDSLLPPMAPNWAHVLGRIARYGMETAGYRASLALGRDLGFWRINGVQWPRWIAFDHAFLAGIGGFMRTSGAVDPDKLAAAISPVKRSAPPSGTRMMLTASYLGLSGSAD